MIPGDARTYASTSFIEHDTKHNAPEMVAKQVKIATKSTTRLRVFGRTHLDSG